MKEIQVKTIETHHEFLHVKKKDRKQTADGEIDTNGII